MEWIYGLSHIVERRSSEENPNDSAQAGGSKKPQEKSIQDHGHIFPVLYYLFIDSNCWIEVERTIQCRLQKLSFRSVTPLLNAKLDNNDEVEVLMLLSTAHETVRVTVEHFLHYKEHKIVSYSGSKMIIHSKLLVHYCV